MALRCVHVFGMQISCSFFLEFITYFIHQLIIVIPFQVFYVGNGPCGRSCEPELTKEPGRCSTGHGHSSTWPSEVEQHRARQCPVLPNCNEQQTPESVLHCRGGRLHLYDPQTLSEPQTDWLRGSGHCLVSEINLIRKYHICRNINFPVNAFERNKNF